MIISAASEETKPHKLSEQELEHSLSHLWILVEQYSLMAASVITELLLDHLRIVKESASTLVASSNAE